MTIPNPNGDIFRVFCTMPEGDTVIYETHSSKVARETIYEMLQAGGTGVGVKKCAY